MVCLAVNELNEQPMLVIHPCSYSLLIAHCIVILQVRLSFWPDGCECAAPEPLVLSQGIHSHDAGVGAPQELSSILRCVNRRLPNLDGEADNLLSLYGVTTRITFGNSICIEHHQHASVWSLAIDWLQNYAYIFQQHSHALFAAVQ